MKPQESPKVFGFFVKKSQRTRPGSLVQGLERRFMPDGPHHVRFDVRLFPDRELSDLLWVHQTVTSDLLEIVDAEAPGYYERRAEELADTLGIFNTA
jgi:hypothetical protein